MEVILVKDVENLGMKNEVVRVKDGFARNYLLPRKFAIPATPGNVRNLKDKIKLAQELREKRLDEARMRAEKLSRLVLTIRKKAGREGRLFGSVTAQEVSDLLAAKAGFEIDRRKVALPEHIKTVGGYVIQFKLEPGISATIKLEVLSEDEPDAPKAPKPPKAPKHAKGAEEEDAAGAEAGPSEEAPEEGAAEEEA